jgi:hypothetical protein
MTREQIDYIVLRMSEARTTLDDARSLFATGSMRSVVNRLYYACFYAASAVVCTTGARPRKHSGLLSAFGRDWVKTGQFPVQAANLLRQLFDLRMEGDYRVGNMPTKEEVGRLMEQAQGFLDETLGYVEKRLEEEPGADRQSTDL